MTKTSRRSIPSLVPGSTTDSSLQSPRMLLSPSHARSTDSDCSAPSPTRAIHRRATLPTPPRRRPCETARGPALSRPQSYRRARRPHVLSPSPPAHPRTAAPVVPASHPRQPSSQPCPTEALAPQEDRGSASLLSSRSPTQPSWTRRTSLAFDPPLARSRTRSSSGRSIGGAARPTSLEGGTSVRIVPCGAGRRRSGRDRGRWRARRKERRIR